MDMPIVKHEFYLWLLKEASNKLLFPHLEKPKKKIEPPKFKKPSGELICISSFRQHTPAIRNFARQSAENFAQVMMFSPLSANTAFSALFEAFPVLMMWLRNQTGTVSIDSISNFINGIGSETERQTLAKVICRKDA